ILNYPASSNAEEFNITPPEVKGKVFSSMLTEHLPRALKGGLKDDEKEFAASLVKEGVLVKVDTPPIINWLNLPRQDAVRLSIDVLLPKYFLGEVEEIREDELTEELRNYVGGGGGDAYYVKEQGFSSDAYLNAYVALTITDMWGPEGLAGSIISTKAWGWFTEFLVSTYPVIKEVVARALTEGLDEVGGFKVVKADPRRVSGSVLRSVLQGLRVLGGEKLVLEDAGKYYLPIATVGVEELSTAEHEGVVKGYLKVRV
ncbi:MAG: hypothetical protein J7L55_04220, partial [Desulfurococcales archaeon]|nr:hypothetical protein [Desulfurococcales archaeon]